MKSRRSFIIISAFLALVTFGMVVPVDAFGYGNHWHAGKIVVANRASGSISPAMSWSQKLCSGVLPR